MNQSDQIDIGDMIFYGVIAILVIAIVAVIIILFEVLIYDSRPVKGTVVAKDFEPSRLENTTSTQISGDGTVMPTVGVRRIPDRWILSVEPTGGGSRVTRSVSQSRWNEIEVGDHWKG